MDAPVDWLLQGEPWVQYRTRIDLLGEAPEQSQVKSARSAMLETPLVQGLLSDLAVWPGEPIRNHKNAGLLFQKLAFTADLGVSVADPGVAGIAERILEHASPSGPFYLLMDTPVHFGGSGRVEWAWMLCDTPLVLYALVRFGLGDDPRVQDAARYLESLARVNGWPCAGSPEMGRFRGPGRKEDPCPWATLAMLKVLSQKPEWRDSWAARQGADSLLSLWENSQNSHPYMFFMGTDFRKLKVPFTWYDLVHVLDVLTQFPWLVGDARLADLVNVLASKADAQGRFTPESIWTAWKQQEFGQKRDPSRWLTLAAWRILQRALIA